MMLHRHFERAAEKPQKPRNMDVKEGQDILPTPMRAETNQAEPARRGRRKKTEA